MTSALQPEHAGTNELSFAAIRAAIPAKCYERSISAGIFFLVLAYTLYVSTTYLLYTASSFWALLAFATLRGLIIGLTFIVGHDACHEALTPSTRWNRVLGQIALLPSLHSFTVWRYRHNFVHHRHTQVLERDNGYPPADAVQFRRMEVLQRLRYRLSRTIPFAGLLYFPEWLQYQLLPSAASRAAYKKAGRYFAFDYTLVVLWMLCEVALFAGALSQVGLVTASQFHPAVMLFFGIVVTQFFWYWEMGVVTFLHHFHPGVPWYRDSQAPSTAERQLISTVHVAFPAGMNWGLFNILEHTAHHFAPQIPFYKIAGAQAALQDAYPRLLTRERFSVRTIRKTFAVCKLWDPVGRRWMGYPPEQ